MELKELLNKKDYNKLRIIEKLMNSERPLSKKELSEQIEISNFLLEDHLEEIANLAKQEKFGIQLIKTVKKNVAFYSLKKLDDSSLKFILFHFFEQSIDYQLLTLLQQKSGCSLSFLSEYFFLSESVLYSHFHHINDFLKTYNIQIKMGKIVGSMLDKYYFFYYFYWFTLPMAEIHNRFYKREMEQFLQYLEQKLEISLPFNVKLQFYLWSTIFFQQTRNDSPTEDFLQELLVKISTDPLYRTIRQGYFTMVDASAFPGNEDFPLYMYIFFTSIFILPTRVLPFHQIEEKNINEPFPTVLAMQQIVKRQLAKLHIDLKDFPKEIAEEIYYLLAQTHYQLFYFKRYISTLNANFFLSAYPFDHRVPKLMHQVACQLTREIENFLGIKFDQHTFQSIRYIYLTILKEAEHYSKDKLTIGVFCSASYLRMTLTVQQTQELFHQRYNSESTRADPKKHYDLLVADTSYFLDNFSFDDYYILSGGPTAYDLKKITEKLDEIYRKKKLNK
jgi:hypothetical protein